LSTVSCRFQPDQHPTGSEPLNITLDNYFKVFDTSRGLLSGLINSFIISIFTSAIALTLVYGAMPWPGSICPAAPLLMVILATQMFPAIVIVIPLFLVMSRINLVDKHIGLIIVYLSFVLPIVIWILKGFFETIPLELERAAAVDGASPTQVFRHVILPISLPPLFATGVFAFIESWNEFFFAIILTRIHVKTAPIAIAEFSGQYQTLYGQMLASAVLASAVVVWPSFSQIYPGGFVEERSKPDVRRHAHHVSKGFKCPACDDINLQSVTAVRPMLGHPVAEIDLLNVIAGLK
jgi:multiple sugar transport system permease protein